MAEIGEISKEQKRILDLRGGKSTEPIEYPGQPIDVYLADRHFQIIDVRDTGKFNVDYLLIDPATFNLDRPTTGFKGLWEGKEIVFGRNYPYRFQYSPHVSRAHVSIKNEGGRFIIKDLNSTNGTRVEIPFSAKKEPRVEAKAIVEAKQTIFERAGKRDAEGVRALIFKVERVLIRETTTGQNKLGRTIEETRRSQSGKEYFVDGKIAYLPTKGRAVFVGDTHGDSLATESIIKQVRFIENMEHGSRDTVLVFLGDYADRGNNSVRNLEVVLALKERYPQNVILMMGNHEEGGGFHPYELPVNLNQHFGKKNGNYLHKRYTELFRQLPNMVVTANGIVAVHGGIPIPVEKIHNLQDLRNNEAAFRQMRWNDPNSYIEEIGGSGRGGGLYEFGQKPFGRFMKAIGGKVMVRSHEYPRDGYDLLFNNRLVTIFSNGGNSRESHYARRVQPKFMIASLTDPISEINFSKHIVALRYFS